MKKEVMKKWVAALRSKKYRQAIGALKKCSGEFCVLGVLCDISKQGKWAKSEYAEFFYKTKTEKALASLPIEVMQWSGVATQKGYLPFAMSLMRLNDGGLESFEDLADIIEENYKEL